jgi:Helix-turn-helix
MKLTGPKRSIHCSECETGVLKPKTLEHDVGALLGMNEVRVTNLPALVCRNCGAVSVSGELLDRIALALATVILLQPAPDGIEARYLRKLLGDTQAELADKLGVDRATVNRWENAPEPVTGANAYALRSHAFLRLRDRSPDLAAMMGQSLTEKPGPAPARKGPGYQLDGASL